MSVKARQESHERWLRDLAELRRDAKARFADVAWHDGAGGLIHAHKVVVYSRAAGSFQQRYLSAPSSSGHESPYPTSRYSVAPSASRTSHDLRPLSNEASQDRCTSPSSMFSHTSVVDTPLSLDGTDPALFEACLDYLYTGEKGAEGVAVLFDGFGEGVREQEPEMDGSSKLRDDLMYSWRSKLFADVTIMLDDAAETTFAAHRAVLCSRSPYFKSLLLGSYGDSNLNHFTLPSPPFTSASTTFILGYIYSGTLEFSSRKFDLSTAFEIWRGAAFLSLSLLQEEVELKVHEMATLQRAARIYNFALSPEVNSQRLAGMVEPWVVDRFGDTWGGPHIGNLEYDAQKKLVRDVCGKITPERITSIAKMTLGLRKRLELEKAMWAEHIRAMLSAIEDELIVALARCLPSVVRSAPFIDLVDGVGFSTDVLEWILELIVRGLRESKAPSAYQALVGSVLLREEGILIDAKVLVEDARNGILKYIQRKWIGVRAAGGFDDLEPWCLKELSDEIEVSLDDLLADAPKLGTTVARAGICGGPKVAMSPAVSTSDAKRRSPSLTNAAARRGPLPLPPPTVRPPSSRPLVETNAGRGPAPTARSRTGSNAPAPPAATAQRPSRPRPAATGAPAARPGLAASSTASATIRPLAALSTTRSPTVSITSTAPSVRSARRIIAPPASGVASSTTPSLPTSRNVTTSMSRRPASLAPSLSSQPSTSSLASTSSTPRPAATRVTANALRPAVAPSRPNATRPTDAPSTSATGSSSKGKEREVQPPTREAATSRRPPSVTSTKSTATLRRPRSASSITSVRAPTASSSRPPSAGAVKTSPRKSTKSPSVKSPSKSLRLSPSTTPLSPLRSRTTTSKPTLSQEPPGTMLLSGIPCIVTVMAERPVRFRAVVRYIGEVLWGKGEWVGVEVAESVIPPEAKDLTWNDGEVQGVSYFKILPSSAWSSGRTTPTPSDSGALPFNGGSSNGGSVTGSGSSSLRPPSRRQRRSSSSEPERDGGPRRGLFVQPSQIVYVL